MGISRSFQNARTFKQLTVLENIALGALGRGATAADARSTAWALLRRTKLHSRATIRCDLLSYGEQKAVDLLRAFSCSPSFVLLDEPAAGLNEVERDEFVALIGDFNQDFDSGILIIEHDMKIMLHLCHRIQVLDYGKTISMGTPQEVRNDSSVIAAYLGAGGD
jgi:branched-chain amino acid transport system ATP-binding protein